VCVCVCVCVCVFVCYRFIWVVPEKGPLNGCVCVVVAHWEERLLHKNSIHSAVFKRQLVKTENHC